MSFLRGEIDSYFTPLTKCHFNDILLDKIERLKRGIGNRKNAAPSKKKPIRSLTIFFSVKI